jgi:hypothetical protein
MILTFTLGTRTYTLPWSQSSIVSEVLVGPPLTVGARQLVFVSGFFGRNPFLRWDLGYNLLLSRAFRWESLLRWDLGYNLLLSRALLVGIPFTVGFRLSRSLWQSRSLFLKTFIFFLNLDYDRAFHELFLMMVFRLSRNFSQTFLSRNGI